MDAGGFFDPQENEHKWNLWHYQEILILLLLLLNKFKLLLKLLLLLKLFSYNTKLNAVDGNRRREGGEIWVMVC